MHDGASRLGPPRWRGGPGHLEVWYATFTDPATGAGFWIHAELLAPLDGPAVAHGWAAVFPRDAPPELERFGPVPVAGPAHLAGDDGFDVGGVTIGPSRLAGRAGRFRWDLHHRPTGAPLYPFPAYVWERELLPAAQVVPSPSMLVSGTFTVGDRAMRLHDATGALARISGHGNAHRWGWLHADLGDGDVLEVVAAQGRSRPLRWLPPKVLARIRVDGRDWPPDPLVAAVASRARPGLPRWSATVTGAATRLRVGVTIPAERAVVLGYRDPDGARAVCTNSCLADAEVRLERRVGLRWEVDRSWSLRASAHAEVGDRPSGVRPRTG